MTTAELSTLRDLLNQMLQGGVEREQMREFSDAEKAEYEDRLFKGWINMTGEQIVDSSIVGPFWIVKRPQGI